jgi:hypothetical protein
MQEDTHKTTLKNDDLRLEIQKQWLTLPEEIKKIILEEKHLTCVENNVKNMLLSRDTINQIELSVLCTLLGMLPYREYENVLTAYTDITESNKKKLSFLIEKDLFTPYVYLLEKLPINRVALAPKKNPEQKKDDFTPPLSLFEESMKENTSLEKRFKTLPKVVQDIILSGPLAYEYTQIIEKFSFSKEREKSLREKVFGVLVGTLPVKQFLIDITAFNEIPEEKRNAFISQCEEKIFRPVRHSILKTLEHTEGEGV